MNLDTRNDVSEVLARICIDSSQVGQVQVDNDISWSLVVGRDFLLYILYHGMKPNEASYGMLGAFSFCLVVMVIYQFLDSSS